MQIFLLQNSSFDSNTNIVKFRQKTSNGKFFSFEKKKSAFHEISKKKYCEQTVRIRFPKNWEKEMLMSENFLKRWPTPSVNGKLNERQVLCFVSKKKKKNAEKKKISPKNQPSHERSFKDSFSKSKRHVVSFIEICKNQKRQLFKLIGPLKKMSTYRNTYFLYFMKK